MVTRVLVTGHRGYIGSVLVTHLLENGHDVTGVDTDYYSGCTLLPEPVAVPWIRKDIRDISPHDLEGFDALIHLAALSNDPVGNLNSVWTEEINYIASARLAASAKSAGVHRFLFASSCIMYGMSQAGVATEDTPLDPRTTYARSKMLGEQAIAVLADDGFSPTFLRNGTIYGASPRMRFDTVLNNLVGSALALGEVLVRSDGRPWRPVLHIQDVARAFVAILHAPTAVVHNQAFNVGSNHLNQTILELAQITADTVPGCRLRVLAEPDADQRTYRAEFSKFARTFPGFSFTFDPKGGARELYQSLTGLRLTRDMFLDRRFSRIQWLRHLLDSNALDHSLRWRQNRDVIRDDSWRESRTAASNR